MSLTVLPWLTLGVWVLYLTLIAPPCYRAWCSGRAHAELSHLPGPCDLPPPTTAELRTAA